MHLAAAALWLTLAPALARACSSCGLTNVSITVEGCKGWVTFNTTSCAGLCFTQDPVFDSPLKSPPQTACNFGDMVYETVHLPGCSNGKDVHFTYPVALSCRCSRCNTNSTDCGQLNTEASGCLAH
ncbi:hypothetical protein COCON_G00113000 [Conger conger]|uniref:CTCK domain-containing protein n=1 Tax=Conger conger TaxID=82655 RepID=A0A9Q1HYJ7_CONCO|nr:follitropin subunit beta [Conger conger]KAJ8272441.1 hypothetical protein COCON_G00113000 [Conger conger]